MINVKIDTVGYQTKPAIFNIISNRLANCKPKNIKWADFCDLVGNKGHAFLTSIFHNNKRNKENFKSQQIFALDFDGTISFNEVSQIAERYGIPIALAYETYSSVNCNRFRIVFISNTPVYDMKVAEIITDALIHLFEGCDTACRDVSRIFLGGKAVIYEKEVCFSVSDLFIELGHFMKEKFKDNHYKKQLEVFYKKHNLKCNNSFAILSHKESEFFYEFNDINDIIYFNFDYNERTEKKKSNNVKTRNLNFNILKDKCKLYNEFLTDERILHHNEIFGIACNMNSIEGGKKIFLEIIENSQYDKYREKDWHYYFNYISAQEYAPKSCCNFCPYSEEYNHAANMVLTAKTNRNSVIKLKENEYFSLEEASLDVEEKLHNCINSNLNAINIIKAQTAIGKTHTYINLIKNSNKKFIIAVPTNILKDEVYQRLKFEGISDVVKTASIQTLEGLDNEIGQAVREFNNLGAHSDLIKFIKETAKQEDKEYLLEYIKPLSDYCREDVRVIVTTHKKFLNSNDEILKDFEIIIDEDILSSSVKNSSHILISDLKKITNYEKCRWLLSKIKDGEEYLVSSPSKAYVDYDTIIKNGITTNVNAFMSATAIHIKNGYADCFVVPQLTKCKCTILSATASEEIYKLFFPDRTIKCFECKEAKYKGKLIQDCTRSYSRRDIDSDEDFFKKLKEENPEFKHIITFLKYKKEADNCIIHFGNTEGCDYMKGQNLIVVGTPHFDETVYKLIATHLGIDSKEKMRFLEVEDSYYKYWLHTYTNKDLRAIQMWLIKTELVQAVGRARLLRYDCTVKLYSSVPLEQAIID